MTVQPEQTAATVAGCWCCGTQYPESEWVRLGQHPEVACACAARAGCTGGLPNVTTNGLPLPVPGCAAGSVPSGQR